MPNTNFQTIHQMGGAINSFVKQATGRDNMQNIDMEHITVAQNHYYEDVDISGRVVSFNAGAAGIPLDKCLVQIEPVQDLHGYDSPWPAGGGKNKLSLASLTLGGTEVRTKRIEIDAIPAGTYVFTATNTGTEITIANYGLQFFDAVTGGSNVGDAQNGATFTLTGEAKSIYFYMNADSYSDGKTVILSNMMIRLSSVSDATFAPYSNICPISGRTGAKVTRTGKNHQGETYDITFPSEAGTVYGGTLDVTTGVLTVDKTIWTRKTSTMNNGENVPGWRQAGIAELIGIGYNNIFNAIMNIGTKYNANTKNGNDILFLDTLVYGKTQTEWQALAIDVQIVVPLATPLTYQLTPQEVETLLGTNNIWADTGNIEVKFKNIKEFF